ncbi:ADP-ribosylglycohydrolase family protein [Amnibacterium setariae]|uniref:Tyrosine specific protein phosphatases domain-containing protein n=1 Tax=Amnibacterium setariae TaxID=2306585 RepID=A0A3A1TUF8_9MICO|nr:ADP-ribosylglycohydrolase family protein [Amnibacterium setariae]RIX27893.1 hypothetical protein D1781_10210 [Amnibacterium setariae]
MSSITDDRAAGAVLGAACGAALAAGGGGGPDAADQGAFWTLLPVLLAAAAGEPLSNESTQDRIVESWTRTGLLPDPAGAARPTAAAARTAARRRADGPGGAGALVRTAPVALPFVASAATGGLARTAAQLAALTDADPATADACVLLAGALHATLRTGAPAALPLELLPEERRDAWRTAADPGPGPSPDGAAAVLLAAQAATTAVPVPEDLPGRHLRLALEAAADHGPAVAAVAGALLGARWGSSAVPAPWRRHLLDGTGPGAGPGAADLVRAAVLAANGGLGDGTGWPAVDRVRPSGPRVLVPHPHDDGVLLGSLAALDDLPPDVDAVVSLCRVGRRQVDRERTDREQVAFWLVDRPGRNPNLDLVLRDAADAVAALRAEGRRVLVHCAEGRSRTPAVGALYAALHLGVPAQAALDEVVAALPDAAPAPFLQEAVLRIGAAAAPPRPLVVVDLDTAVLDLASGTARLPEAARRDFAGRLTAAPGVVALADPQPGAVEAVRRLADEADLHLLVAPAVGSAGLQHRIEWLQRWFGIDAPVVDRLVLAPPALLDRGAVLVGAPAGAEGFPGEVLPPSGWSTLLDRLLAPGRTGRRPPPGAGPRSRERVAGRAALAGWLLEALRAGGGSGTVVQVAADVWTRHEPELRRAGDLLHTWQHDLRRVAARLREEGRLAPSTDADPGVWRLPR